MDDLFSRLQNCHNRYQGDYPRVLCVCSAGLLRSPTIAWVLSNPPYNCNVRVAGTSEVYALVPVDEVLLTWADHIVCASKEVADAVIRKVVQEDTQPAYKAKIWELDLPDRFEFRDLELVYMIKTQLEKQWFPKYEPEL
jgi:predicted protein tyrosine phosphatase